MPAFIVGVAISYFISALTHGANLTNLSATGPWFAAFGFALLCALLTEDQHNMTMRMLAWLGVATSLAGLLVQVGFISLEEGLIEGRLQFTFQYANAAAVWYGTCVFLCLLSVQDDLRYMVPLPATALLLTQSGGGLLVFGFIALFLGVKKVAKGEWSTLLLWLVQALMSGIAFIALKDAQGTFGAVVIVFLVACCASSWHMQKAERTPKLPDGVSSELLVKTLLALLAISLVCFTVLLGKRVMQATESFSERLYQIRDGLVLWTRSPLLGIGPDTWRYLFPEIQSSPYYVTVVHSSYVQLLLDAGLCGLLCLVAAMAVGIKQLIAMLREDSGQWTIARLCCVAFILPHAAIDFDLKFEALVFLLVLLLSTNNADAFQFAKGWMAALVSLMSMVLCAICLLCSVYQLAMVAANARGDYINCNRLYEGTALAQRDPAAQEQYLFALNAMGEHSLVVATYHDMETPTDDATVSAATALYLLGDHYNAGLLLVERMEAHPYDVEFYRMARELIETYGLDGSLITRFNTLVEQANKLLAAKGSLLPGHEPIEPYL